jgi:hypothetical protein
MFFFTKFAFVTCAVYLGIAILVDEVISCVARWKVFSFFVETRSERVTRWLSFLQCNVALGIPDLVADCDDSSACSNVCSN